MLNRLSPPCALCDQLLKEKAISVDRTSGLYHFLASSCQAGRSKQSLPQREMMGLNMSPVHRFIGMNSPNSPAGLELAEKRISQLTHLTACLAARESLFG